VTAAPSAGPRFAVTGGSYAGGVALQIAVQALSLPVLTRLLEPGEYGLVATGLVVGNLLAVVVDLGLSRTATRAYFRAAEGPEEAGALVAAGLVVVTGLSVAAALTASLWSGWLGGDGVRVLQAAVLLGAAMAGRNLALGWLRAADRARAYLTVMVLSTSAAQLLGLLTAARWGTALSYVLGLGVGAVAATVLGVALVRPRLAGRRGQSWGWAGRFGLLLVPGELAAVVVWFSDRIVLERLLGLEAVGRYQVAYTLGSVLLMLAMGISQAWAPVVYAAAQADRPAVAEQTRRLLLAVGGYSVAALALAAPPVLVALIPSEYRPESLFAVTAVVALCVLPLVAQQGAAHLLTGAERVGVLAVAAVGTAVLNVVATLALVPVLGLLGAAVATLVTYVVWAAVLSRAASRLAEGCFRFRPAPWVVAAAGIAIGVALPASGPWLLLRAGGVVLCGVVVLSRLRPMLAERSVEVPAGAAS
jgi:O-antigen/teichoic acid export membrane protein